MQLLKSLGLLRIDEHSQGDGKVGVHLLMGGANSGEWQIYPEHYAVMIGTQDMLLSRAMNRGYAAPRARWPMEFGLLNQDCLWVMDEVQLMDVGLATSGQLQAFRGECDSVGKSLRPCFTWWMSATLQAHWLAKSPDTAAVLAKLPETRILPADRAGHLWDDVSKPCELLPAMDEKAFARLIVDRHIESGNGGDGPTLVVINTVERATRIAEAVRCDKRLKGAGTDVRLVHSRFRPAEREQWLEMFLNKSACVPGTDRIVVATQVIEAGVDVSAGVLLTELAPWPSLVQRFGRCARWGGTARVFVIDLNPKDDKSPAPYSKGELDAARSALAHLSDVAPLHLEAFEESHPELLPGLYPYDPPHLLLRHELHELFDTTPDLSGADIDISRFIRSGEERDLHVFWAEVPEKEGPPANLRPSREALCAVPFLKLREWLCGDRKSKPLLKEFRKKVWVWDWLAGAWKFATEAREFYPGQTVLLAVECGGYDQNMGWSPKSKFNAPLIATDPPTGQEKADSAQDDESLSETVRWQTIATHGQQVGREAASIGRCLADSYAGLLDLAGRWHDAGKVHEAFNGSIVAADRPDRPDLAKAPKTAWKRGRALYPMPDGSRRPGFRHELASTLALFGVLRRHQPDHPALLGPWRELLEAAGMPPEIAPTPVVPPTPLECEILNLDAARFDLLAYLVCSHHGKVRLAWHACTADQTATRGRLRIRGIDDCENLPAVLLVAGDGELHRLPATSLDLAPAAAGLNPKTGAGWTERVLGLLDRHGPFTLAWLEALLRAADQRASRIPDPDPLLENPDGRTGLDESDRKLAEAAPRGKVAAASAGDSAPRGELHGDGGRAGGRDGDPGTTQPPHSATRYVDTTLGTLSYRQLALHLSDRVADVEAAIARRASASQTLDEYFLLDLHGHLCRDLVPAIAGRWRTRDVLVGNHEPPPSCRVPLLMREYAADLSERMAHARRNPGQRLLETLAFAEGQLLHIHPFEDFNGRVTRLFLIEVLYRLDLPIVDPAAASPTEAQRYFAALRAYDRRDNAPLMAIWQGRFQQEKTP